MSCEQLIKNLESRRAELPEKTRERVDVSYYIQYLSLTCREGRSRKTHTSKMLNPASDAEMDEIRERNRQQAENYLKLVQGEKDRMNLSPQ